MNVGFDRSQANAQEVSVMDNNILAHDNKMIKEKLIDSLTKGRPLVCRTESI